MDDHRESLPRLLDAVGLTKYGKEIFAAVGNSYGNFLRAKKTSATLRIPTLFGVLGACIEKARVDGLDLHLLVASHPVLKALPELDKIMDNASASEPEDINEMKENHLIQHMLDTAAKNQDKVNAAILKALKELSEKVDNLAQAKAEPPRKIDRRAS